jgi:dynein heavy chain
MEQYRAYLASLPPVDSPEVFGLSANADIAVLLRESNELLAALCSSQPKVRGVLFA